MSIREHSLSDRIARSSTPLQLAPEPSTARVRVVDPYAQLKMQVHAACIERLGAELFAAASTAALEQRVRDAVHDELNAVQAPLSREERVRVERQLIDEVLGYGPLEPYLHDDTITEVMVNGPEQIYVERAGVIEETESTFIDEAHLLRIIDKIVTQVGRRIDESSPMVDARLPDGSRVNAIIPPLSLRGATLTIRKFSREPYTLDDLVDFGTLTPKAGQFLGSCVTGKLNILVSGGTGTGKTTLMNALSAFIPSRERIVTIEDAAELQLQQRHVVALEARLANVEGQGEVLIRDLVRNALRMRPDRIIVGEVRGAETLDMLQAMNTGHDGSLTTIHANAPRDALHRLEMLVLMAGVELPLRAIREQIAAGFDLIVHLSRLVDGSRRISHITEVLGLEGDVIALQDVFSAHTDVEDDQKAGPVRLLSRLSPSGLQPHFLAKLAANDVHMPHHLISEGAL
jgi:pilus assembly protein CpaF